MILTEGEVQGDVTFTRRIRLTGTDQYKEIEGVITHNPNDLSGKWIVNPVDEFEYDMVLYEIERDSKGNIVGKKKFTSTRINQNNPDKIDIVVEKIKWTNHEHFTGYMVGDIAEDIAKYGHEASVFLIGNGFSNIDKRLKLAGGAAYFIANQSERVVNAELGDYKVDINSVDTSKVGAYGIFKHYNITNYVNPKDDLNTTYKNFYNGWSNDGIENRHGQKYYNSEGYFDRNISPYSGNWLDLDYK